MDNLNISLSRASSLVFCALIIWLVLGCQNDSPVDAQACTNDRDCDGGVCQLGYCDNAIVIGEADDDQTDTETDIDGIDFGLDAVSADSGGFGDDDFDTDDDDVPSDDDLGGDDDDATAEDASEDDTAVELNACGGTAELAEEPDAVCGCDNVGVFICDGVDAVNCSDEGETNACGGCEELPARVESFCFECEGTVVGRWACSGENDLECDCIIGGGGDDLGTCDEPLLLDFGEVQTVDLCEGDDALNAARQNDCGTDRTGQEVVFAFELENQTVIEVVLSDADPEAAIDTVAYIQRVCGNAESQRICSDDVPCDDADPELGACTDPDDGPSVQVRQSQFTVELGPGSYVLVLDSLNYNQFECGVVAYSVNIID